MITTKKHMAMECTIAEHGIVKRPRIEEIRGNLLRTFKRYMRLDKKSLHIKCLIALAYNMDIMQTYKLHKPRPKNVSEVEELRAQIKALSERMEALNILDDINETHAGAWDRLSKQ